VLSKAEQRTRLGIVAYGSSDGAVIEARDRLAELGIHADYLRIRALPFTSEVENFLHDHDTIFVVEQNRDAQMRSLLTLESADTANRLVPILHYNGMPIPSECVVKGISAHQEAAA
jgi:2-oxoglutarate ferredoxin oxidoreductase subunit alpha